VVDRRRRTLKLSSLWFVAHRRGARSVGVTIARGALAVTAVAWASVAFASSAQARVRLHSCAPAHQPIDYKGKQINFYGPLSRTWNVPCSTARAMSKYVTTHEVVIPFEWRGSRWTARLSRPRGNSGPTVYTISTGRQIKVIKLTIAVPVS
jgi:hypothetical protein